MDAEVIRVTLMVVQIVLQASCAYSAYRCFSDIAANGTKIFWQFLKWGFILMTFRRISALMITLGIPMPNLGVVDKLVLPLSISIFLAVGMRQSYFYSKNKDKEIQENRRKLRELTEKLQHTKYDECPYLDEKGKCGLEELNATR